MKVYFVSLGCDKNLVDSEHMLAIISEEFEITQIPEEADIAVVNTCAFIKDAKQESIDTILELANLKEESLKYLVITGCLSQRYSDDLKVLIPEIDGYVGISGINNIAVDLKKIVAGEKVTDLPDINEPINILNKRFSTPPFHTAYLKIAEGCDKKCSYCSIPLIRGNFRSIPMEQIVGEASMLAKDGVSEVILVAQETTVYGTDLYGKKSLCELVEKISGIDGIKWIRLMYCYPEEIDDELIKLLKTNPKVCHYLDIPIQHCSDRILQKMGRRTSKKDLETIIGKLRKEIPDIALRTSLISGFPSESEEDHKELLEFVKAMKFDHLGVFTYSREEGTLAYNFDNQIPERTKKKRQKEIMTLQASISKKCNSSFVGKTLDAVFEGKDPENGTGILRIYRDAPDVDGLVFADDVPDIISGSFVKVRITDYNEYDLIGVLA